MNGFLRTLTVALAGVTLIAIAALTTDPGPARPIPQPRTGPIAELADLEPVRLVKPEPPAKTRPKPPRAHLPWPRLYTHEIPQIASAICENLVIELENNPNLRTYSLTLTNSDTDEEYGTVVVNTLDVPWRPKIEKQLKSFLPKRRARAQ